MTPTPATREEVVELLARVYDPLGFAPQGTVAPRGLEGAPAAVVDAQYAVRQASARRRIAKLLTALEQHGITLVPVEATEEMIFAARPAFAWVDNKPPIAQSYSAMIAASPYKKEQTNG